IKQCHEAIRLMKNSPWTYWIHSNLGNALRDQGQLDAAIAEYGEAIRIKETFPLAHWHLAHALMQKGQTRKAVQELHRGYELGSRSPSWPSPSVEWAREAKRMAALEPPLLRSLKGEGPVDAVERLTRVALYQKHNKLYVAAARWYIAAFAAGVKWT